MKQHWDSAILTIIVALSMATVAMPTAIANHNSIGGSFQISEATQVDEETGELLPDIEPGGYVDRNANVYHQGLEDAYGGNLSEDLPARNGPEDGSGAAYTDCTQFHEFGPGTTGDKLTTYRHALPNWASVEVLENDPNFDNEDITVDNGTADEAAVKIPGKDLWLTKKAVEHETDACYVGFLDMVAEYSFGPLPIGENRDPGGGPLGSPLAWPPYVLNPHKEDRCGTADYLVDQQDEAETPAFEQDCDAGGHDWWFFGSWHTASIDTNLVEAGLGGDGDTPNVASAFDAEDRDWHGSGTISLPYSYTKTFHVYGYPHPANEEASEVSATSDLWDLPFHGVPDSACGLILFSQDQEDTARTPPEEQCRLLGPQDLKLYDDAPSSFGQQSDLGAEHRGRLCELAPDFGTVNAFDPTDPTCGPLGDEVTTFVDEPQKGGFDEGQNVPADTDTSTYFNLVPGWKSPFLTLIQNSHLAPFDYADLVAFNETSSVKESYDRVILTVNPLVPQLEGDTWCERPQIMTSGTTISDAPGWEDWVSDRKGEIAESDDYDNVTDFFDTEFDTLSSFEDLGNLSAPGVYGTYQADAMNVDMRPSAFAAPIFGGYYEGHGVPGWAGAGEEVYPTADQAEETVFSAAEDVTEDVEDDVSQVEELVQQILDDAQEDTNQAVNTVLEAVNELTPIATEDPEPVRLPGADNYEDFNRTLTAGVGCDGDGSLVFSEEDVVWDGALDFGNDLHRSHFQASALGVGVTVDLPFLQDPTLTDDEGESASESNSTAGAWDANWYSFDGTAFAYVDNTNTGDFSGCDEGDGQPDPDADACVYDLPWNVPYGELSEGQNDTIEDLEDDGFRVNESLHGDEAGKDDPGLPYGNGLVSSVEVTGPAVFFHNDAPATTATPVNEESLGSTTCVVLTSEDFHEDDKLPRHVDLNSDGDAPDTDWYEYFCSDDADAAIHFEDAFASTSDPSGFEALVDWVKLTPTPEATEDTLDDSGDVICTTSVFSTKERVLTSGADGPGVSGTTENIQLGADSTETYYTNCDSLDSEHLGDDYEPASFLHQLDDVTSTLPDFSNKSPAWAN